MASPSEVVKLTQQDNEFRLAPIDDGNEPEPIDWLADDYFECAATTLIYGHSGTLKSFIVLHLALCIVTGLPFFGHPVKQGSVVIVAGEGRRGIKKRIRVWEKANKELAPEERGRLLCLTNSGGKTVTACVMDNKFMKGLRTAIASMPEPPLLVVFDTVATTFGLQEETNEAISHALARLREVLVDPFGCAVAVVHHTGKDAARGARGGNSMTCDSDASYWCARLTKEGKEMLGEAAHPFDWEHDRIRMICRKMKDEEAPAALTFRAELHALGQHKGRDIDSLALRLELSLTENETKVSQAWWDGVRGVRPIEAGTGIPKSTVERLLKSLKSRGIIHD